MSYSPLFQVMFTLQNTPPSSQSLGDLSLGRMRLPKSSAKFDLALDVFTRENGFNLQLEFNTDLYEPETAARLLVHFQTLLRSLVQDPSQNINTVNMLTEAEQAQIIDEWNSEKVGIPPVCLHELFENQAAKWPDATAVVCGEESITYGELDKRANQLARMLQGKGVTPEQIVGIYLSRSIEMVATVLGVMKAGGAYLPMDPNYPLDRLQYMIEEAQVSVMITTEELHLATPDLVAQTVVCIDRDKDAIAAESTDKPHSGVQPENLIYVTFTSGSTGRAKGVMIEHRNVVNVFEAWDKSYHLSTIGSHLQMASFSFDVFTGDLSRALCSGAKLVLCPTEVLLDPAQLYQMLSSHEIEAAEFVPAVIRPLIQYLEAEGKKLEHLKLMVVGSDTWQSDEYRRLQNVCGNHTRVINSYGVTEATIDSTYFEMADTETAGAEFVPIGRPFANTTIYLLDQFGNPVPVGVPGELFQGGKGVARGYLNRPDLTAEKFVELDLPTAGGTIRERLYRTGDLAKYRSDGNIAIIGRADNQVKLRGYRIELGEIESVLSRHPDVKECVVALRQDVPGEKRLIAYLTTASGIIEPAELRTFLRGSLPDFMLPSGYVLMTEWKLTPNGKIDRKQLPKPERIASTDESSYVAPNTSAEQAISQIWADLLGVDKVGINDNFFELGGHSLLATQTVSRIRDLLGCEVPLRVLFETPTVGEVAARIEQELGSSKLDLTVGILQSSEDDQELERLLAELESVSDEEAATFLAELDGEYSEAKLGNK
jgi:amino acid adenylation domain-containing protein